nr:CBS domain-containing protein [Desulfobacterales bacterium]
MNKEHIDKSPTQIPSPSRRKNTVITTHINADFDALASMLAAQKLYPDAVVVFPGSQEKNLRNFFLESTVYLFNLAKIRDVDLNSIDHLVLVDTRQKSRIGRIADIIDRPDLEIHIYDHHPPSPEDISGTLEIVEETGATITILSKMLKENGIDLTPEEATIMALGLYEDTGSFTFSSTTQDDYMAAAFFLSKGANLNVVADMLTREMTPQQVFILNEMINGANTYNINGIEVVVTSVSSDTYVGDFAFLVHKLKDMENPDVIFALAQMENRIYLVARSRIPEVDVGEIATAFGGGGHPSAASATIKGHTLIQVEERLFEILNRVVSPKQVARNLMSYPVIYVRPDVSLKDANVLLNRYSVNVLLVIESGNLLGMISRQVLEKALYHHLDNLPVREYMTTEFETITPEATLPEIQEKIVENKQRLLPVVEEGRILGVITRTDLLNIMISNSARIPEYASDSGYQKRHVRTRNVVKQMEDRLSRKVIDILKKVGEVADITGYNAYAVGGFVRDIFLYRDNHDIDIVIEGDGIHFAKVLASQLGARVRSHEKFRTAVVILPDGMKIDVATARLEYYKSPASLPTVERGSLKLDLSRRDFTINTLAIQLNKKKFGTLIDYFGAQKDMKAKAIRVLHNLSFVEDPTRAFRAIRFEQRFGFKIGKLTSNLIENAVKMDFFRKVSGRRLFAELRLILEEEEPILAIKRMKDYGLLSVIHPRLVYNPRLEEIFNSVKMTLAWHDLLFLEESYKRWIVYFMALMKPFNRKISYEVCQRLELPQRYQKLILHEREAAEDCLRWMASKKDIKNSTIYKRLKPFHTEPLLYMMAITGKEDIKRAISKYFTQLKSTTTIIRGKDLKKMGFTPGPIYSEILGALLDARLNGQVKTRKDEIEFILSHWNGYNC